MTDNTEIQDKQNKKPKKKRAPRKVQTGGNLEPNYRKGPRRKLIGLLLYAGTINLKSSSLIDEYHRSLVQRINTLEKEGILAKEKCNGCYYAAFAKNNPKIREIAEENFSLELSTYYERVITEYLHKLRAYDSIDKCGWDKKLKKKKAEARVNAERIMRHSETAMFVDGIGVIDYLPGDVKPSLDNGETFFNTFYSIGEMLIAEDKMKRFFLCKTASSRVNGALFSEGGNYHIYNFSDSFRQIVATRELTVATATNFFLADHGMKNLRGSVVLYKNESVFNKLLFPPTSLYVGWRKQLLDTYDRDYIIPLNHTGQKMMQIMTLPFWEERINEFICAQLNKELEATDNLEIPCDGMLTVKTSEGPVKRYTLLFVIPELSQFAAFVNSIFALQKAEENREKEAIEEELKKKNLRVPKEIELDKETIDNIIASIKKKFEIICFDFQATAIESLFGNHLNIFSIPFDSFYAEFVASCVKRTDKNGNKFPSEIRLLDYLDEKQAIEENRDKLRDSIMKKKSLKKDASSKEN